MWLRKSLGEYPKSGHSRIINGKAPVTADIALRLHDALGISAGLLIRAQSKHSLWIESQKQRPQIQPFFASC